MSADVAPIPANQSHFGERYDIDLGNPLPEFDTPGGYAYATTDKDRRSGDIYALVHHAGVPARAGVYKILKSKPIANLICPKDQGIVSLPFGGKAKHCLVTIFDRPMGGALMTPEGVVNEGITAMKLRGQIVGSALKAIAALHKAGFSHRSIRPTAFYFADAAQEKIYIGECYSCPPSYQHPAALEPIEGGFADGFSRPIVDNAGDFYQLGAALLCLHIGGPLWEGRDRTGFATARVNQGSFWALGGGQDIPGAMGNLVKGLMADDLGERWDAGDVLDWFEGVVKPKRTTMQGWTMNRPTRFAGSSYIDRRLLADAFANKTDDAVKFMRELDFATWAQMSFRDEIYDENDEKLLGLDKGGTLSGARTEDARLVSRMTIFLYTQGPLRYRGLALSFDNIASAVADAFFNEDRERLGILAEVLDMKFLNNIAEITGDAKPEISSQIMALRQACDFAKSTKLGLGMERVLYEMNPELPCQSSKFENSWVTSMGQMMQALEHMASSANIGGILMDRHVAAFMCKHNSGLESDFQKMSTAKNDAAQFNTLVAEFIGRLQKRLRSGDLPKLTAKLVEGLKPAVKSLKSKKNRDVIQRSLDKLKKGGDLSKLNSDINLTKKIAEDKREFSKARSLLIKLDMERVRLSQRIMPTDSEAIEKGIKGARTVAVIGSVIAVITLLL